MSSQVYRISPVTIEDVPAIVEIAAATSEDDRHTQMKALGQEPFDMAGYTRQSMPVYLKRPNCVVIKIVEESTGKIMGVCNWGFRGFTPEQMPYVEGRTQPPVDASVISTASSESTEKEEKTARGEKGEER